MSSRSCPATRSKSDDLEADHHDRPDDLMPPPDSHLVLTDGAEGHDQAVDRAGRRVSAALGVPAGETAGGAGGRSKPGWARNAIDAFVLARLEAEGARSRRRRRTADAHPPGDVRPDRPAADAEPRSTRSWPTRRPTPTRRSSTGCSPRPPTASGWQPTGSTPPATPTPTASTTTRTARCGRSATGSSTRSTRTSRSTQFIIEQLAGDLLPERDARPEDRVGVQPQPRRQHRRRHHRKRSTASSTSSTARRRPARCSSA